MQKIRPLLWFNGHAEEAAKFYVSIFKDSKIEDIARFGDAGPGEIGSVMMVEFVLEGQDFMALNGGDRNGKIVSDNRPPQGAVALFVSCETQAEVDRVWDILADGGEIVQCGWLRDRYGFAWNIVPDGLQELLGDPDPARAQRAMVAMLAMKKLDINELRKAADAVS